MTPVAKPGAGGSHLPGPGPGSAARSLKQPSPMQRWWRSLSAETRKQVTVGGLIAASLLVLGVGGWYNVSLFMKQADLKRQIEAHGRELGRSGQIRTDIRTEQVRAEQLQTHSAQLYAGFPDVGAVPIVVGQLERIALDVGGQLTDVQYQAPRWDGDRGSVSMRIAFVGDYEAVTKYVESVGASMGTLRWDALEMHSLDDAGLNLQMTAMLRLDVLRVRPDDVPSWRDDQVQLAVGGGVQNPFARPAVSAARPLPRLELHGIVRQGGRQMALMSIDGVSHVVRAGQTVGGVTVVQISNDSVLVGNGDRTAVIRLID